MVKIQIKMRIKWGLKTNEISLKKTHEKMVKRRTLVKIWGMTDAPKFGV